ncbi:hypothetical protein HCG51_15715 [Tolypothrix sp. PCC 7910]|uniref:hypothetical protein n=1 Tax=Tolypothrix sp. PCC 7910 TaxID=2099387 RepID=UPI0014277A32|nr:hypothetical protein [Tolypothrix sp. PCC 7910]QIR38005.1 hypothetical protein HCG51_15715 [Tolypothrix sp. PCC 7910]
MNIQNFYPLIRAKSFFRKLNFFFLVNLILCIYFFIAFLPLPGSIQADLDPSWMYAISQAAQKQMIFGQDIIFTYGPLGYLITGATLYENFLQITIFRWLVYVFLLTVSILKIVSLKNHIQQLFIGLSIVLTFFFGMSTDYQILLIFLIILSFDNFIKKYPRLLFLLLGVASGFCALTKFTLGIYTFGSLNIFLLVNFYQSFRRKSKSDIVNYIFAIINSCLGLISTSLIFLAPDRSVLYLNKIIINLLIAGAIGVSVGLIQKRIKGQSDSRGETRAKFINISSNNFLLPWLVFYVIYSLLLVHIISSSQSPSLIDYLKNSLEISSGYSSAMSFVGSKIQVALAISDLFIVIWLMLLIAREGALNLSLSLFFVLLLSFKHGFVRQDIHVVIFAEVVPIITSLLILKISRFRYQKMSYYLCAYILIISLLISPLKHQVKVTLETVMPNRVINNLIYLVDIKKLQSKIEKETINNLARLQLPDKVKNLVNGEPIDIIPWEISLVPANQLNWKPRPIFQSYSAYTTTLDNINFDSLSKKERNYLFYQFISIDGRHPFFDEPQTFHYIFCNYEPSAEIPDFIKIPKLSNIFLLEKLKVSRCSPTSLSEISSISWDTPHPIEASNGAIIRTNVKFQYSLVGKIYKILFRAPPVMMKIDYVDGSQKTYRIIPENSENGVIVSYLPREDNEAMSFFRGQLLARVKSFSFQTNNSLLYTSNIKLNFSSELLRY